MSRVMRRSETCLYNKTGELIASFELWSNGKRKFSGDSFFKEMFKIYHGNPDQLASVVKNKLIDFIGKIIFSKEFGFIECRDFVVQKKEIKEVEIN